MSKICDHKSVGMFIWNDDKLLLIERGKRPYGFAVPAGHVDGDKTFEIAAIRELKEEVGLDT
ncbi:MAG: NUDIX hydrolase, partial [Patescibacteria group bacterium]